MGYGRLIDIRCLRHEELHELRQFLRHLGRSGVIIFGTLNIEV
jgi:hypothetical protein